MQQSHRVRTIAAEGNFPEAADQFDWAAIEKAAERFPMGLPLIIYPWFRKHLGQIQSGVRLYLQETSYAGTMMLGKTLSPRRPIAVPGITHRYPIVSFSIPTTTVRCIADTAIDAERWGTRLAHPIGLSLLKGSAIFRRQRRFAMS